MPKDAYGGDFGGNNMLARQSETRRLFQDRLLFAALPNSNAIGVVDLDTLTHAATIPVGPCPYAVAVDPERRIGITSNQGTPTANATASVLNLCPVYAALGRAVSGCPMAAAPERRDAPFTPISIPPLR